jgi:glycerol transport system ATP-binding protein
MNLMPCRVENGQAFVDGQPVATRNAGAWRGDGQRLELGVRPEFVSFAAAGLPVEVVAVADAGRHRIVQTRHRDLVIRMLVEEGASIPSGAARLAFDPAHTQVYADGWMVGEAAR